jgi:hypothetical protein
VFSNMKSRFVTMRGGEVVVVGESKEILTRKRKLNTGELGLQKF